MLKVAVVGCGKIADGHVEQVRATGRGVVVAVCDAEPLMARQLAERMQVPATYSSYAEMLERERPDVVHIATPPDSHPVLLRGAVDAGAHVFVEKPFALRASDVVAMLDYGAAAGRKVGVNYLYNFETPGLELERVMAAGTLGEIVHAETAYGYNLAGDYGLAVLSDPGHWVHRLPGKLFHNVLDHVLAKVVPLLPMEAAVEVQTLSFRRRPASGDAVVDALADELRFLLKAGTVTVSGIVSAHGRPVQHTLRVVGTQDTVALDYAARTFTRVARQTAPSAIGRLFPAREQSRQFKAEFRRNLRDFMQYRFHYFQPMRVLLGRFYDAVEGKGPDPVPPAQIRRVAEIIDAIVAGMAASEVRP